MTGRLGRQYAGATEFVKFRTYSDHPLNSVDPPMIAFTAALAEPTDLDWYPSTWTDQSVVEATGPDGAATSYSRPHRILVGPAAGGIPLPPNSYGVWRKITDTPEVAVERIATYTIE